MKRLVPLVTLAAVALVVAAGGRAADGWPPVLGEQRVLVVLVTWGPEPFPQEQVRDVVFRQADAFFRAASYGQMHLAGTVTPWLHALPEKPIGCNQPAIARVGRAAAAAAGYAPSSYDKILYLHPDVGCPWIGLAQGNEAYLDGELFVKLITHELGHTFGLFHANSTGCGPECAVEYGDPYDTMGDGTGDYNPYEKYRLGWLTDRDVTWVAKPGDYAIDELETPSPRSHALVIRTAHEDYWVEDRRDPAQTVAGDIVGVPGVLIRTGSPVGRLLLGVTDYSAYDRLIADPAGRGRAAMLPGDRYELRGVFSLGMTGRRPGRAQLRFAWDDTTAPAAVGALHVSGAAGGIRLTWLDPRESGSGISSYRISIDGGRFRTIAADPAGSEQLTLGALGPGLHRATLVAVDRAGNRGAAATKTFRLDHG